LDIVDVSTPADPVLLGRYDLLERAQRVRVSGPYAYVTDAEAGLKIFERRPSLKLEPGGMERNVFHLRVSGPCEVKAQVQHSPDLKSWSNLNGSVTLSTEPIVISDPLASQDPHRFYRTVVP
jgi:hypothetical protein